MLMPQAACKVLEGEVIRSAATVVNPFGSEVYLISHYITEKLSGRNGVQFEQLLDTLAGDGLVVFILRASQKLPIDNHLHFLDLG